MLLWARFSTQRCFVLFSLLTAAWTPVWSDFSSETTPKTWSPYVKIEWVFIPWYPRRLRYQNACLDVKHDTDTVSSIHGNGDRYSSSILSKKHYWIYGPFGKPEGSIANGNICLMVSITDTVQLKIIELYIFEMCGWVCVCVCLTFMRLTKV